MDLGIAKDKPLPPAIDRELLLLVTELADGRDGRLPERFDDSLTPERRFDVSLEVEEVVVDRVVCEGNEVTDVMDSLV